jgi:hypothetical protein
MSVHSSSPIPNTVTVAQSSTQVVRVITAGPRGPQGPQGPQGEPGIPFISEDWLTNIEKEIPPTESITISGDFVLEDSTLLLSDSGDQYAYGDVVFKKQAKMYIGGNLLVKDSSIINNGLISVGGGVILIGNSTITGTGILI